MDEKIDEKIDGNWDLVDKNARVYQYNFYLDSKVISYVKFDFKANIMDILNQEVLEALCQDLGPKALTSLIKELNQEALNMDKGPSHKSFSRFLGKIFKL